MAMLASDYWSLMIEVEGDPECAEVEIEIMDCDRMYETLGKNKKKGELVGW